MGPVRIATFNLHHGAPPNRSFSPVKLRRSVARLGVDLLALQEVDRHVERSWWSDQARIAGRSAGLHATFVSARRLGVFGQYGIALLTRTRPTALEVVRLPTLGAEPRVAVIASVDLGGRRVSVAATHLHNRKRVASVQLGVVLERLSGRPGPHLLLGDLNAGPDVLGPSLEAAGFEAALGAPTFPTRGATDHIDWIVARGLELGPPEVPSIWASDHFPLVTTVPPAQ